jgi:hypothetical protein
MAVATIASAVPFACSTPESLQGNGGQCTQTTDCQPGLMCVPQKVGPGMCSNNLSTIVSTEEAGSQEGPPPVMVGDGSKGDAPTMPAGDGGTTKPPDGGSVPEAQPPVDHGTPPPQEAAPPPPEAGDEGG